MLLDLSVKNSALSNLDLTSSDILAGYIDNELATNNRMVAYGGYLEKRGIYNRSEHFYKEIDKHKERNIHLGLDLWCKAGTTIHACAEGAIHSFKNNDAYGDYGPTIILEHKWNGGSWYSLYGHLSSDSISGIEVGHVVRKGELIGRLGQPFENGDYPPHLHFQIIRDIEGKQGDYPGVCSTDEMEDYKDNCPDPDLLLGIS